MFSKQNTYPIFNNLRGDISGGISAAVVSIPGNIVYGTIAFSALGNEYLGIGVLAGMFSSVFAGFFAALFGGTRGMVTGPQAPTALLFGATLSKMLEISPNLDPYSIISLLFLMAFASGFFQFLMGMVKIGTLVKFIPYPVIAGILTGTGILILKSQFWVVLGIGEMPFTSVDCSKIKWFNVLVLVVTILAMLFSNRIIKKLPASIMALLLGVLTFYLLKMTGLGGRLGETIGNVPSGLPIPKYILSIPEVVFSTDKSIIISLLPTALTVSLLSSIDSLLSSVSMQSLTGLRSDTNKELRAQGIGTMTASLFGGLPGTGFTNRSYVNWESGGRTKLSGIIHSLLILVFIAAAPKVLGYIPKVVMSGLIAVIGFRLIDKRNFGMLIQAVKAGERIKVEFLLNALIVITVAAITLMFSLIIALGIGLLISVLIFIAQLSKGSIRRVYSGERVQSNTQRSPELAKTLTGLGNKIAVIELEGSIFFGSADEIAICCEEQVEKGAEYIILDIRRITHVDNTAIRIIEQILANLKRDNNVLAISYLEPTSRLWNIFIDYGLYELIGDDCVFEDTQMAIEHCENKVLETHYKSINKPMPIEATSIDELFGIKDIDPFEALMIADYIQDEYRMEFNAGDIIFKENDVADCIYFISKGIADIYIPIEGSDKYNKVQSYGFGTYFGESAMWGEGVRSARVVARENTVCVRLTIDNLQKLANDAPNLAANIRETINRTTFTRLNESYRIITELES